MKIMVTGHSGIVGKGFLERFSDKYEIVGYSLDLGDDLSDYDNLVAKMRGCEMVVHLAAISKPVESASFDDYLRHNVQATANVLKAACEVGIKRVVYASSTTVYGIEKGIPFASPVREDMPFVSQYLGVNDLRCRPCDLSYHTSKVMSEQQVAWYGLNKKVETLALRFGPVGKVFLGTSVSMDNACHAIDISLSSPNEFWYEPFSIVDDIPHIDITKARTMLGYTPTQPKYPAEVIRSTFEERTTR